MSPRRLASWLRDVQRSSFPSSKRSHNNPSSSPARGGSGCAFGASGCWEKFACLCFQQDCNSKIPFSRLEIQREQWLWKLHATVPGGLGEQLKKNWCCWTRGRRWWLWCSKVSQCGAHHQRLATPCGFECGAALAACWRTSCASWRNALVNDFGGCG